MEKDINKQIEQAILEMAKNPQDAEGYHRLSELYLAQQDYDKVMSVLESLLTVHPNDERALIGMGTMWFYEKDFRNIVGRVLATACSDLWDDSRSFPHYIELSSFQSPLDGYRHNFCHYLSHPLFGYHSSLPVGVYH